MSICILMVKDPESKQAHSYDIAPSGPRSLGAGRRNLRAQLSVMTAHRERTVYLRNPTMSPKCDTESHVEAILVDIVTEELQKGELNRMTLSFESRGCHKPGRGQGRNTTNQ